MTAILLKLLRPALPYLLAAAVAVGLIVYVGSLRHHLAVENQKNVQLAADNEADLAAIAAYKAQEAKYQSALATLDAQTRATDTSVDHIADTIAAAPAAEDAPVAPVLLQALAGLRALQGGAP